MSETEVTIVCSTENSVQAPGAFRPCSGCAVPVFVCNSSLRSIEEELEKKQLKTEDVIIRALCIICALPELMKEKFDDFIPMSKEQLKELLEAVKRDYGN